MAGRSTRHDQSKRTPSSLRSEHPRPSDRTVVYTDGACSGNPGPGGWAWVIPGGRYRSGSQPHTTNQRMELAAALDAVRTIEGTVEIVSDSTYVVNCFRQGWWKGWISRGWVNSKKQPVANRDLWEPLIEICRARPITFRWVKGHGGNEWNDIADRLAVQASMAQEGVEGQGTPPPDQMPAPDRGGSRRRSSEQPEKVLPPGHTVVFAEGTSSSHAGHGGWAWAAPGRRYRSGAVERSTRPRMELTAVLDAVRELEGALEVVSNSGYVVDCFRNGWWKRWLNHGWTNSKNKPVANRDLWEPLIEMYRARPIAFRLAAAADDEWTGKVEWLASEASRTQQGTEAEISESDAR